MVCRAKAKTQIERREFQSFPVPDLSDRGPQSYVGMAVYGPTYCVIDRRPPMMENEREMGKENRLAKTRPPSNA